MFNKSIIHTTAKDKIEGAENENRKVKEIAVSELWKHEQYDFSGWLFKEENIQLLTMFSN